jgi:hypothetical protein
MKNCIIPIFISLLLVACSGSDDPVYVVEYDCVAPSNLTASSITHNQATIDWYGIGDYANFILEYGQEGFVAGQGTIVEYVHHHYTIKDLDASTNYEFFVTSKCMDGTTLNTSNRKLFRTEDCPVVNISSVISITTVSATVRWSDHSFIRNYEVEYGEAGFSLGTGTTLMTTSLQASLVDLNPGTAYDVYVRAKCGSFFGDYSEKFTFETQPLCFTPTGINWTNLYSTGVRIYWNGYGESSWQIQYGLVGFTLGTGTTLNTSSNPYTIQGMQSNTTYEIYIRANCGSNGYSNWSQPFVITTL